jgi:DNA-binding NtrC family response regulator
MPELKRRLSFLLVEKDQLGLSPRKLLIEAAKHNVVTALSIEEGLQTFRRFQNVDAVAIDARFGDTACSQLVHAIKQTHPNIRIVAFQGPDHANCSWADFAAEPHEPQALLKVLAELGARTDIG